MEFLNRVFPLRQNWQSPVIEEYEFKTGIGVSYNGTETREALRSEPRVSTNFSAWQKDGGIPKLRRDLLIGAHVPFFVPRYWMGVRIYAYIPNSDPSLPGALRTEPRPWWITPGMPVAISTPTHIEGAVVDAVQGDNFVLKEPLIGTFTTGEIFPAWIARIQPTVKSRAETANFASGKVDFDVVPGHSPVISPPAPERPSFAGRPVFLDKPNWRNPVDASLVEIQQEFDPGFGRNFVETTRRSPDYMAEIGLTNIMPETRDAVLAHFMRCLGKRGEFWVPTWLRDVPRSGVTASGTTALRVIERSLREVYQGHPVMNHVIARWPDGSWQINRIAEVQDGPGYSDFEMVDPWEGDLTEQVIVQFCILARSSSDVMRIVHLTSTVSETTLAVQSIPNGHLYGV